jgi:hypothetical protein
MHASVSYVFVVYWFIFEIFILYLLKVKRLRFIKLVNRSADALHSYIKMSSSSSSSSSKFGGGDGGVSKGRNFAVRKSDDINSKPEVVKSNSTKNRFTARGAAASVSASYAVSSFD